MGQVESPVSCRTLPAPIRLEGDEFRLGRVKTAPLLKEAIPWEDGIPLLKGYPSPVYLEHVHGNVCLYPIRPSVFLPKTFFQVEIFSESERSLPNEFGKPAKLWTIPDLPPGSGIWDPGTEQFFAPQIFGLRWYLVGDYVKATGFLGLISMVSDQLKGPELGMMGQEGCPMPASSTEPPPPFDFAEYLDDVREINQFKDWLGKTDPRLASAVGPHLSYDKTAAWKMSQDRKDTWAFFDSGDGKIHLTPIVLDYLRAEEYFLVASILAHEARHQQNFVSGYSPPSLEILGNALSLYFDDLHQRTGNQPFLWPASAAWHIEECSKTLLPLIAEEEISAFAAQLAWISVFWPKSYQPPIDSDYRAHLIGAIAALSQNSGGDIGSTTLNYLGLSYFNLTSFQPSASSILELWVGKDWEYRMECSEKPEGCEEISPRMKLILENVY